MPNSIAATQDEIKDIIDALRRPTAVSSKVRGSSKITTILKQGWAHGWLIEDLLHEQDSRLGWTIFNSMKTLASKLDLTPRFAYLKPRHSDDEFAGYPALSATEVACALIWLERLGFHTDASLLCDALHKKLAAQTYVSDEELTALTYMNMRHKMAPVTVSVVPLPAPIEQTEEFETPSGYRVEIYMDDEQQPIMLQVHSPGYVEPPLRKKVTCPVCDLTYISGLGRDEHEHNVFHNKVIKTLQPVPSRALRAALASDPNAVWVTNNSPKWLRIAVERCARAFKREMGYDFTQWCAEDDPEAIAFLFHDDRYRIIGACCFRPTSENQAAKKRLDWIWLCPDARRRGYLSKHWDLFLSIYGEFDIEHPISPAMEAFLRKKGLVNLIR